MWNHEHINIWRLNVTGWIKLFEEVSHSQQRSKGQTVVENGSVKLKYDSFYCKKPLENFCSLYNNI